MVSVADKKQIRLVNLFFQGFGDGLWGWAKLTIRSLIKKSEKYGLFWVYTAIFMIKNRIIDELRFPQFKCTFTGLNATAPCHGSHGPFNTFDKRAAANGNTFRPPPFPFGVDFLQIQVDVYQTLQQMLSGIDGG